MSRKDRIRLAVASVMTPGVILLMATAAEAHRKWS